MPTDRELTSGRVLRVCIVFEENQQLIVALFFQPVPTPCQQVPLTRGHHHLPLLFGAVLEIINLPNAVGQDSVRSNQIRRGDAPGVAKCQRAVLKNGIQWSPGTVSC